MSDATYSSQANADASADAKADASAGLDEPRLSDRQLLAAYRRGDREAAERLVERTYSAVYAAAVKLCGDPTRADDLTQEAYRKAWQSLDRFEGRSKVSTWLYRIVYTTFLNSQRGADRERPLEEEIVATVESPGPSPEASVGTSRRAEATRRAVFGLPSDLRDTVAARYWADLPVAEIAKQAGVTPVAIRKRLKKAFDLLSTTFEETQA